MNTTIFPLWDSFFKSLLDEPDAVLMIRTPEALGQRKYSEFDIDIEPARLCTRILSVREQIAREMVGDLKAIANMGQQIFDSYWHNAKNRKNSKQTKASVKRDGVDSSPYGFDRPGQIYIEYDPMYLDDVVPSPLRKGNFDLLYTLTTQEAVLKLLERGVEVGEDEVQNKACTVYLESFYRERLVTHFVGSQWYGKGDDFIEELMLESPIMSSRGSADDGNGRYYNEDDDDDESDTEENDSKLPDAPPLVIEPLRIAEQVLLLRDKLALEWMDIMQNVPSDHTDIRKMQLSRLMGQTTPTITEDLQ